MPDQKSDLCLLRPAVFDPNPSVPDRAALRRDETNFNAFLAKASASSRVPELKHYAIWALRRALKDVDWTDAPPQLDADYDAATKSRLAYLCTVGVLDGYVPQAAQWMFYDGRHIFHSDTEYIVSGSDPARSGKL